MWETMIGLAAAVYVYNKIPTRAINKVKSKLNDKFEDSTKLLTAYKAVTYTDTYNEFPTEQYIIEYSNLNGMYKSYLHTDGLGEIFWSDEILEEHIHLFDNVEEARAYFKSYKANRDKEKEKAKELKKSEYL